MAEIDPLILCDAGETQTNMLAADHAVAAGHRKSTLTYPGSEKFDNNVDSFELDMDHLKEANRYLMRANKSMHRSWPRRQLNTDNALRRDSWIARWAHQIYMFGLFTQDASLLKINTDIAWAAQMYVDRFLYDNEPWDLCELYLFDMKSESWWQWKQQWTRIESVPSPSGVYTIIGQDNLTNAGKAAMKDLFSVSQ